MKKIALVLAFAAMSFAAVAQDTICFPAPDYLWCDADSVYGLHFEGDIPRLKASVMMPFKEYVAPRDSLTVYGVAIVGLLCDSANIGVSLAKKGTGNTFTRHDTAYFGPSAARRYFTFNNVFYPPLNTHIDTTVNCYEVYFDKPLNVTDTFYTSCWTDDNTLDTISQYYFVLARVLSHNNAYYQLYGTETILPLYQIMGIAYPIVRPYCPRPEAPVVTVEGGEALFGWAEGNPQYELSVARRGTDPDSGSLFATTDTTYSLAGLDSGVWYTARVRAACDRYDSLWWSAWSLPAHFYLGSTNPDSLGIATAAGARFALSPNPAAGQVTVTAEEGLRHIEVYDARGALVYSAAADGTTAVVETKAWPTGQFVVTVETRAGKGSRVLTVAR